MGRICGVYGGGKRGAQGVGGETNVMSHRHTAGTVTV
jgi:hypothetical protein